MVSFVFRPRNVIVLLVIPLTGIVIILSTPPRRIEIILENITAIRQPWIYRERDHKTLHSNALSFYHANQPSRLINIVVVQKLIKRKIRNNEPLSFGLQKNIRHVDYITHLSLLRYSLTHPDKKTSLNGITEKGWQNPVRHSRIWLETTVIGQPVENDVIKERTRAMRNTQYDFIVNWRSYEMITLGVAFLVLISAGLLIMLFKRLRQRREEHASRALFNSMNEGVCELDLDGRCMFCNPATLAILGYSHPNEILGNRILDMLYPAESEYSKRQNIVDALASGKAVYRSNERFVRADKSTFPVEYYAYPLRKGPKRIGAVLQFSDLTEHERAVEKIEFLAHHDSLTGLPGRLLVADRIEQTIAFAKRTGEKVGILFIDIDNFRLINDSLGHIVGDALLRSTAQRLRGIVRETDTVGRHGGDEFLVVLTHINRSAAITPVLEKIVDVMSQVEVIAGYELSSSVSVGVAVYPDDGEDFGTLLTRADMAMYYAKDAGKNTYRFFDNAMNRQSAEALYIRAGLYRALQQGEFILHYQPQIDLATGRVNAAEALVRWQDSERGLISPAAFIPIAESDGLIVPLGQWVLHEACRQAMVWQKDYGQMLAVAVNISAIQLKRGDLEQTVRDVLETTGLSPVYLKLELTESILLHNADEVVNTLHRLKQLGVKLSIDDFGTGYSCLAYLKKLSVDALKIDQSFIKHMIYDDEDAAIVHAIIKMAHSLNLQVVAEGVEDAQTQAYLRDSLCNEAQGYYIARPLPAKEFMDFIEKINQPLQAEEMR